MSNIIDKYITRVEHAFFCANNKITKLTDQQFDLDGMSAKKNRIFLNKLIQRDTVYLEIGVWRGSTLVSALYKNQPKKAYAIDNFVLNSSDLEMFMDICKQNNVDNFQFFNEDCFDMNSENMSIINNVNTYYYDGDHSAESHMKAITYYKNVLDKYFIFIVDDWNWPHVQQGTYEGYVNSGIKVHKKWDIFTPFRQCGDKDWWNGYHVAVCEKT